MPQSSFNYKDVGVNLEMTPRVTYEGEIVLDGFVVESSALGPSISVAGQDVPSFSSRKVTTKLRLREGESTLLAGLLRDEQRKILTGFPGIMHDADPAIAVRLDQRRDQAVRHRHAADAAHRAHARADGGGSVVDLHRHAAERRSWRAAAAHRAAAERACANDTSSGLHHLAGGTPAGNCSGRSAFDRES